ncbi:MAG: hypothetical protein AAGJ54_12915, partial [Planctomycetota bacterium]
MKPNTVASDLRALTNERDALRTRIAQFEAIVAKLPTTADGVPVVFDSMGTVAYPCPLWWIDCGTIKPDYGYDSFRDYYSTEPAAEAAAASVGIGT